MSLLPLPFEKPIFDLESQLLKLEEQSQPTPSTKDAIRTMRTQLNRLKREVYEQLNPWDIVRVARHEESNQLAGILPGAANTRILCP